MQDHRQNSHVRQSIACSKCQAKGAYAGSGDIISPDPGRVFQNVVWDLETFYGDTGFGFATGVGVGVGFTKIWP